MTDERPLDRQSPDTACDYCGLPVLASKGASDGPRFCCLGCQLAASITRDSLDDQPAVHRTAMRLGLAVFFSMNVMVFTMALWSWDAYTIASIDQAAVLKELLRFACLLFATPVVLLLGRPMFSHAIAQLRGGLVTTDCLLIIGVAAAFGYSVVSLILGQPHIYFEVACMILVAATLGRWLEAEGKHRAMKSLQSLRKVLPETARVLDVGGTWTSRPLSEIDMGQMIRVLPGERLPLDGTIQQGQAFVDQQLVTGESQAICKGAGEPVYGGTLNLDGCLDVRVDREVDAGVIQRLLQSVREAANQVSEPQRVADRMARVFVPLVFVMATSVFLFHQANSGFHTALMSSMAVALIACPCALAIATPLAMWAALGCAAKQGVVFRSGDDLVGLAEVDYVLIDKTGTITTDAPCLHEHWCQPDSSDQIVSVVKQLAGQTMHPLARTLGRHFETISCPETVPLGSGTTVPGRGVKAPLAGLRSGNQVAGLAAMGSRDFCLQLGMELSGALRKHLEEAGSQGMATVCVGWAGRVRGVYAFTEQLRDRAAATVTALKQRGLASMLLTGDQQRRASRVASAIDISFQSELLPEHKQQIIKELQSEGHKVAMLGDGLNDAPALGVANVGIALGCGADVTRDAADVCLMSSTPALLPWAIDLARATKRTIRRNLAWALAYNSVGIGLAATGHLNPIFAAVAMVLSSGFVIAESLRLSAIAAPTGTLALDQTVRRATANEVAAANDSIQAMEVPV